MPSRIAHVIPYVGRDFGGPVIAMAAMVDGLISNKQQVAVYSVHHQEEGQPVALPQAADSTLCQDLSWGALRHSSALWSVLDKADISLIHSHGLWTDVHRCAAVTARKRGVPHVLGPCGMLEANALRRSSWKKRLVSIWFQNQALKSASCLLANSEKEYLDIRRYGLKNPVAIIPNPVPGPESVESVESVERDELLSRYPALSTKKTVLFLGRLHPVKGLERLIDAWAKLRAFHEEWQLVLAGPDEGGYRTIVEKQIEHSNCQATIHLLGTLDQRSKWGVLRESDILVMPSDFENFGMSAAEAMLVAKPVVATTGTPWQVLADNDAGWWVDRNPEALAKALQEAMELTDAERQSMGARGQSIAKQYSPDRVAGQLISLYKWLLRQGEQPGFIRLD